MMKQHLLLRALALLAVLLGLTGAALTKNGFDFTGSLVPADEILSGGPPRDGIPAIDKPKFINAGEANYLRPQDRVLGIMRNGVAKAYPIRIMDWHEIVNDRFGDEAVVVTYCPLCGTGMAFDATVGGKLLDFGVSGLLYNSDVLLYDRQTQSLWSQIKRAAISGAFKGEKLKSVPLAHTTWADWQSRHPATLVLSTETGFRRDYDRSPYAGYDRSEEVIFPVKFRSRGYHPKEQVIGLEIDGKFKAYPFVELARTKGGVSDEVGGRRVSIRFDAQHRTGAVFDAQGREIPTVIAFWFAWFAFHPDTEIYSAN